MVISIKKEYEKKTEIQQETNIYGQDGHTQEVASMLARFLPVPENPSGRCIQPMQKRSRGSVIRRSDNVLPDHAGYPPQRFVY